MNVFVKSKTEAKEAISLLEQLGYKRPSWAGSVDSYLGKINFVIISHGEIILCDKTSKEAMSIGQLRDLVVLKRNDVADANYIRPRDGKEYFKSSQNNFYHMIDGEWIMSTWENGQLEPRLKPIEKPMKEYLVKTDNGNYLYAKDVSDILESRVIEIPEGCNIITCENRRGNIVYFHWKYLGSDEFFLKDEKIWGNNFGETLSDFIDKNEGDVVIIWKRHNLPEELPFIGNEVHEAVISDFKIGDSINHPPHYASSSIECIDAMQAMLTPEQFIGYLRGNIFKYQWRYENKGGIQDLEKSQWYLNRLLSVLQS